MREASSEPGPVPWACAIDGGTVTARAWPGLARHVPEIAHPAWGPGRAVCCPWRLRPCRQLAQPLSSPAAAARDAVCVPSGARALGPVAGDRMAGSRAGPGARSGGCGDSAADTPAACATSPPGPGTAGRAAGPGEPD